MPIEVYTASNISACKQPLAIYDSAAARWYAFPGAVTEASLEDYKLWAEGSGRSMTGENKGTLVGIFPKLQLKIGRQTAPDRAVLTKLLNQPETKVRAYSVERQRFETAVFYFGDVSNKIKKWDKSGTLGAVSGANQPYTNSSMFDALSFSVIANKRRS